MASITQGGAPLALGCVVQPLRGKDISFTPLGTRIGAGDQRRMKDHENGRSFLPLEQATGHSQSAAGEMECEVLEFRRKSLDRKELFF